MRPICALQLVPTSMQVALIWSLTRGELFDMMLLEVKVYVASTVFLFFVFLKYFFIISILILANLRFCFYEHDVMYWFLACRRCSHDGHGIGK